MILRFANAIVIACWACATPGADLVIEEVVVLAQKREAPLQTTPIAVSVLTGAQVRDAGVRGLFDAAELIPALDVVQNTGPLNTGFRIRRIGNEPNIPTFEPAVGLFVDQAFRSRSGVAWGALFDIERIEVLRGPQNALYGKNTTAGVIHILTRAPTRSFGFFGEVSAGVMEGADRAGMLAAESALSGPLSDTLSARLSGAYLAHDHLTSNRFNGDDTDDMRRGSIRGQLLYEPFPGFSARLIAARFEVDSANSGDVDLDTGIAPAQIDAAFGVPCPSRVAGDRVLCRNRAGIVDFKASDLTLNLAYERGGYTLTGISGYEDYRWSRDFDADQLNIQLVDFTDRQDSDSFSQELRIASPSGAGSFDWLLGVFYHRSDHVRGSRNEPTVVLGPAAPLLEFAPGLPYGQPGNSGSAYSQSSTSHQSVFGNFRWALTRRFELSLGARWQKERKRAGIENYTDHNTPTIITLALFPPSGEASLARSTSGVSWNVIGQYRLSERTTAFVSLSRGFKAGGFNAGSGRVPPAGREFDDETVFSIEGGLKARLHGDRWHMGLAAFKTEYDDFQSAGFISLRYLVNNAERVEVSGFEADVRAAFGERWSSGMALSYADARYVRYTGGACHYARPPDNADGSACVQSGKALPLAPRWITSAHLRYERATSHGAFFARLDWQWTDRQYTNTTLDPRHVQPAYSLVNLRGGWRFAHLELSLWVRNATDATYVLQAGPTNLFGRDPAYGLFLGAPRSWGLTLRGQW